MDHIRARNGRHDYGPHSCQAAASATAAAAAAATATTAVTTAAATAATAATQMWTSNVGFNQPSFEKEIRVPPAQAAV